MELNKVEFTYLLMEIHQESLKLHMDSFGIQDIFVYRIDDYVICLGIKGDISDAEKKSAVYGIECLIGQPCQVITGFVETYCDAMYPSSGIRARIGI